MSGRKILLIVLLPIVAVVGVSAVAIAFFFEDPAPNRFLVGASPVGDGGVVLHIGECLGGQMERLVVAVDHEEGLGPNDTELWVVEGTGANLTPGAVTEVTVGAALDGMTETTPLAEPLPIGETLQVEVRTTEQGFGFFYTLADLEEGQVWADGYGAVSPDRFEDLVSDTCD